MTMKSIKRYLANLGRLILMLAFAAGATAARAQINVQKVSGGANSITQDLAIGVGRTLTIAGTITGSGPIGTTGTISAGTFSATTISVSTLSVSTLTASVASIATASISALNATNATISALTVTTLSLSTVSLSNLTVSGTLRSISPTGAIGYGDGAGSSVIQGTSKATAVTLNNVTGVIAMNSFSLSGTSTVSFTLSNSNIGAQDIILVSASTASYSAWATSGGTATTSITVKNESATTLSESPNLLFILFKGDAL